MQIAEPIFDEVVAVPSTPAHFVLIEILYGCLFLLSLSALNCSGFKSEQPLDGGLKDAESTGDATPHHEFNAAHDLHHPESDLRISTGPGPLGALPSGYCCTSHEQCRFRNCLEVNGTKMCADECSTNGTCQGLLLGFICVGAPSGRCEPEDSHQTCTPADTYLRGEKKIGQCCVATADSRAGQECEGGRCAAFGKLSNPFLCTQVCTQAVGCPAPFTCNLVSNHSICMNLAESYTCD